MSAFEAIADITVGLTVWLPERRHNEDFGGGVARGLSSGVWWTTVAMTQRGAGNFGPRTMPGRAVAMLWMVGSIIAIAVHGRNYVGADCQEAPGVDARRRRLVDRAGRSCERHHR